MKALEKAPELKEMDLNELQRAVGTGRVPKEVQSAVRNHGGVSSASLKPLTCPTMALLAAIHFESFWWGAPCAFCETPTDTTHQNMQIQAAFGVLLWNIYACMPS